MIPILTITETAETLRCSRSQVFKLIRAGVLLRTPRRFGKQSCVFAESVYQALEKGYDPPAAAPKRLRVRHKGKLAHAASVDEWMAQARAR